MPQYLLLALTEVIHIHLCRQPSFFAPPVMSAPFQVRPSTDPLERERREIERRRARLEDRRQRILQAKTRLIGVDTQTLQAQIKQKSQQHDDEKRRDAAWDSLTTSHAKQLTALMAQQQTNSLVERYDLAFVHQQQASEKRRKDAEEADRRHRPEEPSQTFLQFAGEDPLAAERAAAQKRQQAEWATAQVRELEAKEQLERQEEADYDSFQQRILQLQRDNEQQRQQSELAARVQQRHTNQALAGSKKQREQQTAQREQHEEAKELTHTFYSDFLTETVRPEETSYCYKGMSVHQRQAVVDTVWQQMKDQQDKRARERKAEADYDKQQEQYRRQIVLADIARREEEQKRRMQLSEERKRQSVEKSQYQRHLNTAVYINPVDESYFQQFNTTCR